MSETPEEPQGPRRVIGTPSPTPVAVDTQDEPELPEPELPEPESDEEEDDFDESEEPEPEEPDEPESADFDSALAPDGSLSFLSFLSGPSPFEPLRLSVR